MCVCVERPAFIFYLFSRAACADFSLLDVDGYRAHTYMLHTCTYVIGQDICMANHILRAACCSFALISFRLAVIKYCTHPHVTHILHTVKLHAEVRWIHMYIGCVCNLQARKSSTGRAVRL